MPAHGVGSRQDLPLPFTALVIGASVALVASFLGLAVLWREPRLSADDGWRLPAGLQSFLESAGLRRAGRVVIGLVTLWFLLSLVFGVDDANNPVPYVVFVWLWVGMPFVSLLLGGWWGAVNPMRLLHRALTWVARIPDSPLVSRAILERIGLWPAAVGVFAFTWLELIADDRATLRVLRVWIGFFVLVSIIGSLLLGSGWFRQGDPFEVLSRLYGKLSPLGRRTDGDWVLRSPVHGPTLLAPKAGLLATTAVMLGGTAFDSLGADLRYAAWVQSQHNPILWRTLSLAGVVAVVAGAMWGAAALSCVLAKVPLRGAAGHFAPSLIPIAAGYLVAHYWSLLMYQGPRTLALLSDPFGTGANLLGTGGIAPSDVLIRPALVAVIQAGAIVLGHLLGIVVAHEKAISLFPRRAAVMGQVPVMILMILYTVTGLSLLFSG